MKQTLLATCYGLAWVALAPAVLWWWCQRVPLALPAPHAPLASALALALGLGLWLGGVWRLRTEGGGLPMNAFPPPQLALGGSYALVPHPIYTGFALAWAGWAGLKASAPALWLGTPLVTMICLALVWGYERPDLARRFGAGAGPRPWIGFPAPGTAPLSWHDRFGAMLAATLPWLVSYGGVKLLGAYPDAVETRMAWEWLIPVPGWTMLIYSSPYLLVPLLFLCLKERAAMRRLLVRAWLCTTVATLLYLTLPLSAAFRAAQPGPLSNWLNLEQLVAWPPVASWPSFHVVWTLLAAQAAPGRWPRGLRTGWALAVALSCLTTGMHSLADVLAGWALWLALRDPERLWRKMLAWSERSANAWRCWQRGPLRLMRHSLWAGLAGATGFVIVLCAAAPAAPAWISAVFLCGLLGAALWAQALEGSPLLGRPFGYYGALLGGALGVLVMSALGADGLRLAGALALAAAPMQALGRVRCLEQGCCHGQPVAWGIRVHNPHSRAVALAGWTGVPIHPTPLYSLLGNLVCSALLARLWALGAPLSVVAGAYLVFSGVLRFVEEAYRGEPQTPRLAGLPLYQWLALLSLLAGMALCLWPSAAAPGFSLPRLESLVWSLPVAALCALAMGVDFPRAKWRFSRLSG